LITIISNPCLAEEGSPMVVESILEMVMGILELEEEEHKLVVGGEEEEEEYLASLSKSLPLEFLKQKESEHKLSSKSDLLPLLSSLSSTR
jgi:hypothetical protein